MIRGATSRDFDELLPLFRAAHKGSIFKDSKMDELHMKRMFSLLTAMPGMFCEVVENDGKIVGVLGGGIDRNAWGVKMAMDIIFISSRDTHKLLRRFITWAKANGADYVHITSLVDNSRYDKLLTNTGLKHAGHSFAIEV